MLLVKNLMTANPRTVHSETSLEFAVTLMKEINCRQLPVLDDDRLIGIITERDIRLAVAAPTTDLDFTHHTELRQFEVGEFMSANLTTVTPDTSAADAATLLRRLKIGALPVLDGSKLVGIITVSDCLACLSDQLEEVPSLLLA